MKAPATYTLEPQTVIHPITAGRHPITMTGCSTGASGVQHVDVPMWAHVDDEGLLMYVSPRDPKQQTTETP